MSDPKNESKLNIKSSAAQEIDALNTAVGQQSQADLDRETSRIRLQTEQLRLKREILELKKLESDIAKIDADRAKNAMSHDTVEDALKHQREDMERHQTACNHMKGGASIALLNGAPSIGTDSNNYAMIQHTFSSGCTFRLCQRCGKTWFPKDPDYKWAMSCPTRNTPSAAAGGPGLVTNHKSTAEGGVRMESEIPHRVAPPPDIQFGSGSGPAGH